MPEISVVAPVYNQRAETLIELVRRLSASLSTITDDFEVILVDDGSLNDAWLAISNMARSNPKVTGFHSGEEFRSACRHHRQVSITPNGNWVVVMDADLQDRPEVIPELYAKAQQGYDVVFVNRAQRP